MSMRRGTVRGDAGRAERNQRLGVANWRFACSPAPSGRAQFTVAQDARRGNPGSTTTWNRGNVA